MKKFIMRFGIGCLLSLFLLENVTACKSGQAELLPATESSQTEEKSGMENTETEAEEETDQVLSQESQGLEETEDPETEEICVYICGQVEVPGVYHLATGSRICDAIELAGGFTDQASQEYWNLAEELQDGEMIAVPSQEEAQERGLAPGGGNASTTGSGGTASGQDQENSSDGRVNLNTASLDQLMTIPGIGETKAEAILSYREENGAFSSIEDVMQVPGIKEATYSQMEAYITVN